MSSLLQIIGSPAFDGILLLVLVVFEVFLILIELDVRRTAKASHEIEVKTYELYKTYFETTEKRKAEAREKAAATRARKREDTLPPPMALEEEDNTEPS